VDLVIVDLMMPVMDGPEMVRKMRQSDELSTIPVILMTALPEAIPTDPTLHFVAILVKRFSLAELHDAIARVLTRS
jgi:CheY-like chemotaxis protein